MDFRRSLTFRGFDFNSIRIDPTEWEGVARPGRLSGVSVDDFIVGAVQGIGYTEKRAASDGYDASDVYLGNRRYVLQGAAYGDTSAVLHDLMQDICAASSPTGAYTASPGSYGYLPLIWYEPTLDPRIDADGDGNRWRKVYANARPLLVPERHWIRDRSGGKASLGQTLPYTAYFEAIDPRIYMMVDEDDDGIAGGLGADLAHALGTWSGEFTNRGDYPAPVNVMLVIATQVAAKQVTITVGGCVMQITVPSSSLTQIIRFNGSLRILTVEENGIEVQRQDLLSFTTEIDLPVIPPTSILGAPSAWTVASTVALSAGSRMWYHEALA